MSVHNDRETKVNVDNRKVETKRAYSAPQVTKCGTVVQLTQGMNGTISDHGQGMKTRLG